MKSLTETLKEIANTPGVKNPCRLNQWYWKYVDHPSGTRFFKSSHYELEANPGRYVRFDGDKYDH